MLSQRSKPKVIRQGIIERLPNLASPAIRVIRKNPKVTKPKSKQIPPRRIERLPSQPVVHKTRVGVIKREDFKKPKNTIPRNLAPQAIQSNRINALKGIGKGRYLVMIAAGPSVLEIDLKPLKTNNLIDFMCINKPFEQIWPAKFWAFCDHTQYKRNQEIWAKFNKGKIINSPNVKAQKQNQVVIKTRSGKGWSTDLRKGYYIGRSSTYANMQVVSWMGYKKCFIFGVDMCSVGNKLHFYGKNPDVSDENRKQRFASEAEHYLAGAQKMPKEDKERFIFCSKYLKWPFVKHFEHWDHKESVEKILDLLKEATQK